LKDGGSEIEIAASLDPNNSLIRSYLGKVYYEEKRTNLDGREYAVAKALDPQDPTPWFYDAIRKQTVNRPVEALEDLQKSIELNDNRAVYRSRFLLDQDLAARSSSLARIYNNLGFQQLGLVEGWKSVNTNPGNYSAHRFLSDSYSALPRHEIARTSELLQSQLLQPINITPLQPQLAESNLFLISRQGPSTSSFNTYNPLFNRNQATLLASGFSGTNDTWGGEGIVSGIYNKLSLSAGYTHFETDGFRTNNDQDDDISNVFTQLELTHKTSIQAEYRYRDTQTGDLPIRFDPNMFFPTVRNSTETESMRLGLHHAFTPRSHLLVSFISQDADYRYRDTDPFFYLDWSTDEDGYMTEVQHLFNSERFHIISGAGYFDSDQKNADIIFLPPAVVTNNDINSYNVYLYSNINFPKNVTLSIGASADFFERDQKESDNLDIDEDQFNPKFGITWNPIPATTLRAAVFRTLRRRILSDQTLEPTQIAGFNQFFDDGEASDSWRYGIAVDQKFSASLYGGVEFSKREIDVPYDFYPMTAESPSVQETDWEEELARAYLYWTPHRWLALSAEYQYEDLDREPEFVGPEYFKKIETHRLPLGIGFFHPCGISTQVKATYVDQEGKFGDPFSGFISDDDQFWVVDAAISYRLPKRWGFITLEIKNLFDEEFNFQDTDPANPWTVPEQVIIGKCTLNF
jgi:tetratricopeptide (TPR) repeat protein